MQAFLNIVSLDVTLVTSSAPQTSIFCALVFKVRKPFAYETICIVEVENSPNSNAKYPPNVRLVRNDILLGSISQSSFHEISRRCNSLLKLIQLVQEFE